MRKPKNNPMTEGEFFASLAKKANYLPEDTLRDVYYGLVKFIMAQFREGKQVNLPHLGRFTLAKIKGHKRRDINTGQMDEKDIRQIYFLGCAELKNYIQNMEVKVDVRD